MFRTIILRLTHKLWQRRIEEILRRSYQEGILAHRQLGVLIEKFDRRGPHQVY